MVPAGRGDDAESLVGTTIAGKYFVHQLLGRGGMADVYKATLLGPDRPVALKLLVQPSRPDPTLARRFEREAAAASRLRHPNAIEVVDFGAAGNGSLYLAMEFVPGGTLAQAIAVEAPIPAARAVHLAAQVLSALAEAHAKGVIHRDLKPANVMIDPLRDPAGFVKVLDFGIAILGGNAADADERLTGRDVVYGTPAYMSPEQIRGEPLDPRSDLYSVGVILFEMLSGVLPFDAPTPMAIAAKHLADRAPRLSERRAGLAVPPPLEAVVARALEKDPALRPASAEAMRADLQAALAASAGPVRAPARELPPTEGLPRLAAGARRTRLRGRGALAAAAAAAAIAAALLLAGRRDAVPASRAAADGGGIAPAAQAAAAGGAASAAPATGGRVASAAALAAAVEPPRRAEAPAPEARPGATAPRPAVSPLPRAGGGEGQAEGAALAASPPRRAAPAGARDGGRAPRPAARAGAAPIREVRGELNALPTPPAATGEGVLVVVATPWAEVSVDGVALGETPREVRLRAGTHAVRATHPDLGVREERVAVGPGERKLWAARFEQ